MLRRTDLLIAAALAGCTAGTVSGQTIVPYLLEGDEAPGTFNPPDLWESFDRPIISESGVVLVTGDTNAPTSDDAVVFAGSTLIGLENMPDPDFLGVFSSFQVATTSQEINRNGDAVFIASLRSPAPTTSNEGVYKYDAALATLSTVVVEGDPAPGIVGRSISDMEFAAVFDTGGVGFLATLDDSSTADDSVIYRDGVVLYREGDVIASIPQLTWTGDFDEVAFNGAGDVFFEGRSALLVLNRGGTEQIVLSNSEPVAVRDGNDFVNLLLQTRLAEDGTWGIRGNLQNAPSTSDAIIITGDGMQFQQGEPIAELPGAATGNFNGFDLNSNGQVVYLADIEGAADPNIDKGLFVNDQLLAHVGMQVPGQAPGTVFTDIDFEDFSINDAGQVVFHAYYNDVSVLPSRGLVDGLFMIELSEGCLCETDGDAAQVDVFDLLAYLDLWFAGDPPADIDGTPGVDVFDLLAYLDCWFPASAGDPCS